MDRVPVTTEPVITQVVHYTEELQARALEHGLGLITVSVTFPPPAENAHPDGFGRRLTLQAPAGDIACTTIRQLITALTKQAQIEEARRAAKQG